MIVPSIAELTQGKFNRYTLVIATAKCAKMITDEYVMQRELAERRIANKETDKSIASMIRKEYRDDKAVKTAVNGLYNKDFVIVGLTDGDIDASDGNQEDAEKAAE
mgnify:CR=1 FL=1